MKPTHQEIKENTRAIDKAITAFDNSLGVERVISSDESRCFDLLDGMLDWCSTKKIDIHEILRSVVEERAIED